ncbi:hypothetical protein G6F50_016984 [Rhizopus delemar]|uniref:Uncharacterized protein n=1 Tax=Rhizopus delemar TaxID=936053 RepID=A0A9P6XRX7_9FUNG|nr:hypothetical protein G6F50_016984 [Rhizopus delemar]
MDDRQHFGVVTHAQAVLADHIDVALVELAEAAALGALAAVDALHLRASGTVRSKRSAISGSERSPDSAALASAPVDCTKYTWRSVSPPDLVSSTSDSSNTGVSTGRNPKRS